MEGEKEGRRRGDGNGMSEGGKGEEKASCSHTSGENTAQPNNQKLMGKTPQRAEM